MAFSLALGVTPEMMKSKAAEVTADIEAMRKNILQMEAEIRETGGYWKGDAGEMQRNEFDSHMDEFNQMNERLKTYPTRILQMAGIYEEAESEATQTAAATRADISMS